MSGWIQAAMQQNTIFPVSFSGYIQRPKSIGVLGFVPQQHEQIAAPFFLQHESTFMAQYLPQRCE